MRSITLVTKVKIHVDIRVIAATDADTSILPYALPA
jgi:transcriptional regulator of acetoin/glycerol metabolism